MWRAIEKIASGIIASGGELHAFRKSCPEAAIADIALSFDHLVGAGKQRLGNIQTQRLGRLQIDDQLEFGRRLYRQIAWSGSLQNPIDIEGRSSHLIEYVDP